MEKEDWVKKIWSKEIIKKIWKGRRGKNVKRREQNGKEDKEQRK